MKVLPVEQFGCHDNQDFITIRHEEDGRTVYKDGVIEITAAEFAGIIAHTHCFNAELTAVIPYVPSDEEKSLELKQKYSPLRAFYIDAYRKYQAAVNYGEFGPISEVDAFVARIKDKDWTALEAVPPALKYFCGEVGFEESGLTVGTNNVADLRKRLEAYENDPFIK